MRNIKLFLTSIFISSFNAKLLFVFLFNIIRKNIIRKVQGDAISTILFLSFIRKIRKK